jgi:5-methylthioadenosine/S-adenosylhomocysteine deaminase
VPARRIAAPWVVPMDGPPIADGAVLIDTTGRISAVGPESAVSIPPGVPVERWTDAAILPGLVNSHTHLELTGFGGEITDPDFPGWIRHLISRKAARSAEHVLAAARQGIHDCWAGGVTTVADTGDSGAPLRAMAELGASGIAYQEVFGPHPDLAQTQFSEFRQRFETLRPLAGGRIRIGVSPHAPYSVSGPLYAMVSGWARSERLPVAVHVAESLEEVELVSRGAGPFAGQWRTRGIPMPETGGATPLEWLDRHGVLGPHTLCIHAVRAGPADIGRIARTGSAVAHCPRSNRRHAGLAAPLAAYLRAGVRVGVGTDSAASVSPLDLLAEARHARDLAQLSARAALDLVTGGAARAIGLADEVGTLRPGLWGDLALIRTGAVASAEMVLERVLDSGPSDVLGTVLGGREVYRRTAA